MSPDLGVSLLSNPWLFWCTHPVTSLPITNLLSISSHPLSAEGRSPEGPLEARIWAAEPESSEEAGAKVLEPGEEPSGAGIPAVQAKFLAPFHETQVVSEALEAGKDPTKWGQWLLRGMAGFEHELLCWLVKSILLTLKQIILIF